MTDDIIYAPGEANADLPEKTDIPVTLAGFSLDSNTRYPEAGERIKFVWELPTDLGGGTLWTWVNIKLGKRRDGTPAKLVSVLNALIGRRPSQIVRSINKREMSFVTDDSRTHKLAVGMTAVLRGAKVPREDGGMKFDVVEYKAAASARSSGSTPLAERPMSPPPSRPVADF